MPIFTEALLPTHDTHTDEHDHEHEHDEHDHHHHEFTLEDVRLRYSELTDEEHRQLKWITAKYTTFCCFFVFANAFKDAFCLEELLVYLDAESIAKKNWVTVTGLLTSALGSMALSAKLIERSRRNFVLGYHHTHTHSHTKKEKLEDFFSLQLPVGLIAAAGALSIYSRLFLGLEEGQTENAGQYIGGLFWAVGISGITVLGNSLFHLLFANEGRHRHETLFQSFKHLMTTVGGQAPKTFMDYAIIYIKISSLFSHVSEIFFEMNTGTQTLLEYLFKVRAPELAVIPPSLMIACAAGIMHGNTEAMAFEEFTARAGLSFMQPFEEARQLNPDKQFFVRAYLYCVAISAFFHMLPDLIGFPDLATPEEAPAWHRALAVTVVLLAYGISDWISSYVQFAHAATDLVQSIATRKPLLTIDSPINRSERGESSDLAYKQLVDKGLSCKP